MLEEVVADVIEVISGEGNEVVVEKGINIVLGGLI